LWNHHQFIRVFLGVKHGNQRWQLRLLIDVGGLWPLRHLRLQRRTWL
jgi:hypothetical protein